MGSGDPEKFRSDQKRGYECHVQKKKGIAPSEGVKIIVQIRI